MKIATADLLSAPRIPGLAFSHAPSERTGSTGADTGGDLYWFSTDVAFADLATSLDQAVRRSVPPRHDNVLTVELIAGDASYKDTRLSVSLVVRATLRLRYGDTFVAQKQVVCRDGAIVEPEKGARVIWSCMTRIGQDLGGWLEDLPQ